MLNKAIFAKMVRRYVNFKYLFLYLVAISVPLFFISGVAERLPFFNMTTLDFKAEYMLSIFLFISFVWICGAAIAMLSSVLCSFIAEEAGDRTLLISVSKPVSRTSLILSKFLGFIVVMLIYSVISLLVSVYLLVSLLSLDIFTFLHLLPLSLILIPYSLLISIFFGSIALLFSSMSSSRLKVIIPIIILLVLTFFAMIPTRSILRSSNMYKGVVEFIDVGYDMGNIYLSILEGMNIRLIPFIQTGLGTVSGVYEIPKDGVKIDFDHNFIMESLDKAKYHSKDESFLKILSFTFLSFLISLIWFNRRDVH